MKNVLIILALGFLCSQCTRLEFEQPLPVEGQEIKTLPRTLVGIYQSDQDSGNLVSQYQRIAFIPKDAAWEFYTHDFILAANLDTTKAAFVRNDSLFQLESDTSSPIFIFQVKRLGDRYVASEKLRYHIEPVKGKFVLYDEETGKASDHTLILRKQGDLYFFNIKASGAKYWQTTTLQQTPQGITFQYLSAPLGNTTDLPFATRALVSTSAEGTRDTIRLANPTDLELSKYMENPDLVNREKLRRVSNHQN